MLGRLLGHYRILEKIGAGGMGVVYRARDERLGRDVAVKVLPAAIVADGTARHQLLREAQTASALNHPHICTIHEVGEANGQVYVAMELVDGKPLSAFVSGGNLPIENVIRYGSQIAAALDHAHERGIIHRDLKSANVMITREGDAKILDFGLATRLSKERLADATRSRDSLAGAGPVGGTLAYLSPEVLQGETGDMRSDIWALGVVLYEMATGALPFRGRTGFELSAAILRESPAPLPSHVPAGLRGVIQRCLAKEPSQRYQRAGEVRAALEAIQSDATQAAAPVARGVPGRGLLGRRGIFALAAAVLLTALLIALNAGGWRERLLGRTSPARIESLAVLPLENLSRDPEQDYFADGMTELLIADLSKISALRVISRTSAMHYKGIKKTLPEIAHELNVDAVVEGSVQRSGERVRITAQLIEARSDRHLWAESYERDLRDVLALQSEVARAIFSEIKVKLTPREQTRLDSARPVNPHAYELYLKGRFYWSKRTDDGLKKSVGYFNQALEEDPTYALAWAGLADTYLLMGGEYRLLPPPEARPRAKAAALKALDLDPNLGEAHASLGLWHYHQREWTEADKEFKLALELAPNYATAYQWYALFLNSQGRDDEALLDIRRAQTLDPLSPTVQGTEALILYHARRYDEAIEKADKAVKLYPNFPWYYAALGLAYVEKGRFQEGLANLEHAAALSHRHPALLSKLGYAYGRAGRRADALSIAGELEKVSKQRYVSPFDRALVYAGLGEREQVLAWLEKAYEVRDASISINMHSPWFDSLRSDPRFQDLLRRIGLPP